MFHIWKDELSPILVSLPHTATLRVRTTEAASRRHTGVCLVFRSSSVVVFAGDNSENGACEIVGQRRAAQVSGRDRQICCPLQRLVHRRFASSAAGMAFHNRSRCTQGGRRVNLSFASQVIGGAVYGLVLCQCFHRWMKIDISREAVLLRAEAKTVKKYHVHDVGPFICSDQENSPSNTIAKKMSIGRVRLIEFNRLIMFLGTTADPRSEASIEEVVFVSHNDAVNLFTAPNPTRFGDGESEHRRCQRFTEHASPDHEFFREVVRVLSRIEPLRLVSNKQDFYPGARRCSTLTELRRCRTMYSD